MKYVIFLVLTFDQNFEFLGRPFHETVPRGCDLESGFVERVGEVGRLAGPLLRHRKPGHANGQQAHRTGDQIYSK
jgi:hypothetical protein